MNFEACAKAFADAEQADQDALMAYHDLFLRHLWAQQHLPHVSQRAIEEPDHRPFGLVGGEQLERQKIAWRKEFRRRA